jgi:hypothetical protein
MINPLSKREDKIKFYEDHLVHLEKHKTTLDYDLYNKEKEAIGELLWRLKNYDKLTTEPSN